MSEGHENLRSDAGQRGRLYVVATPIGNLADITLRALEVLRSVALVLAEDTRTAQHLLAHHGLSARLKALHEHNEASVADEVIAMLDRREDVALVSEAGTPTVSDPGARLIAAVRAAGCAAVPIPGANAAIAARSVSGRSGPFAFVGFLPPKPSARRKAIETWREFPHSLVLYEAPHRIVECVADLAAVLGAERRIVVARELTKLFETVHECALGEAVAWLDADPNRVRGEFTLVVEGAPPAEHALSAQDERLLHALLEELPVKQAVRLAAEIAGGRKNAFYERALALKGEAGATPDWKD